MFNIIIHHAGENGDGGAGAKRRNGAGKGTHDIATKSHLTMKPALQLHIGEITFQPNCNEKDKPIEE